VRNDQVDVVLTPVAVREQMERILASRPFANAHRSQRFLSYLVDHWLKAPEDSLKEYTIAVEVFERDASYDPAVDATVRVEAGRLRSRLRDYYFDEGCNDALTIEMPKGGYRLTVTPRQAPAAAVQEESADGPTEVNSNRANRIGWYVAWSGVVCLLILGAVLLWIWHKRAKPNTAAPSPVVMAVLPFSNQTGIASNNAFAEGLTQNLIRQCSEIPRLHVMARGAVENVTAGNAARQLGISVLLTGTLRKDDDGHLAVDGEISNARDGSIIRSRE